MSTVEHNPLTTRFAGLVLRSPIIAASAPPTELTAAIVACARAGIGAVVTKSIADYHRADWPDVPRRTRKDRRGLWIQGSFASETLTLQEGVTLIKRSRDAVDIPLIASVGVLNPEGTQALEVAHRLVEAGADMIHLDLFYLPQPRANDATITALVTLFEQAARTLTVPFAPKLNLDLPADLIARALQKSGLPAVFLLDSIRVPIPLLSTADPALPNFGGGLECSLFGAWQKPISLQYTRVLADAGYQSICAGGGLSNADDIIEAIMLGATTVQVATPIMTHGTDWIRRTTDGLLKGIAERGVENTARLRGAALTQRNRAMPEHATPVRAVIDPDVCKPCPVCTKLTFCPFIGKGLDGMPSIATACYGCGFCEPYCPQPGAIKMVPA